MSTIRDRFLDWLYEQEGSTGRIPEAEEFREFFDHERLNSTQRLQAVRPWARQGLIEDHSSMGDPSASLTAEGREHVLARRRRLSDTSLRRRSPPGPGTAS
jgi:hypothetical protein